MQNKEIFHVHTYRCEHASLEKDEEYVLKAIELGAKAIAFTDHTPFPDDKFLNRMRYSRLDEYVNSLKILKEKYKDIIEIKIGLEIEFLPSYSEYYKELKMSNNFDILMIGQHFYEVGPNEYSFSFSSEENKEKEFIGCGKAIVEAINTDLFDVVAHPDRIFRHRNEWSEEMKEVSKKIISAAIQHNVLLEQNESSKHQKNYYWNDFWKMVPEEMIVRGLDAHSTKEIKIL